MRRRAARGGTRPYRWSTLEWKAAEKSKAFSFRTVSRFHLMSFAACFSCAYMQAPLSLRVTKFARTLVTALFPPLTYPHPIIRLTTRQPPTIITISRRIHIVSRQYRPLAPTITTTGPSKHIAPLRILLRAGRKVPNRPARTHIIIITSSGTCKGHQCRLHLLAVLVPHLVPGLISFTSGRLSRRLTLTRAMA